LKNGNEISQGDAFCPLGLLWVKKLNRTNDYSVTSIDKQGRGGMIFAHLVKIKVENEELANKFPLSKRHEKFNDSVVVRIYSDSGGKTSYVTFRCTRGASEAFVVGCNAIIDVLRGHSTQKKPNQANTTNSSMPQSSSEQYVAKQKNINPMHAGSPIAVKPQGRAASKINMNNQSGRVNIQQLTNDRALASNQQYASQPAVIAKSHAEMGAPHLWEA